MEFLQNFQTRIPIGMFLGIASGITLVISSIIPVERLLEILARIHARILQELLEIFP